MWQDSLPRLVSVLEAAPPFLTTMTLTGSHLIAGRESAPHGHFYHGVNPATSAKLEPAYADATSDEADEALAAAQKAQQTADEANERALRMLEKASKK